MNHQTAGIYLWGCMFSSSEKLAMCATSYGASFDFEELHMLNMGHKNGLSGCRLGCRPSRDLCSRFGCTPSLVFCTTFGSYGSTLGMGHGCTLLMFPR